MRLIIKRKAIKKMRYFPEDIRRRLMVACKKLETFPEITSDIKNVGLRSYRMRKGSYRIAFYVENDLIVVTDIDTRGDIGYD